MTPLLALLAPLPAAELVSAPLGALSQPAVSEPATVYIFRPDFSSMGKHDSPAVWINGKEVGRLDHGSFIELVTREPVIRYALKPSAFASSAWDISGTLELVQGRRHYLAVWTAGEGGSNNGMTVAPGLGPLPLLPVPITTPVRMRVMSEAVDEEAALAAMQELKRAAPALAVD